MKEYWCVLAPTENNKYTKNSYYISEKNLLKDILKENEKYYRINEMEYYMNKQEELK